MILTVIDAALRHFRTPTPPIELHRLSEPPLPLFDKFGEFHAPWTMGARKDSKAVVQRNARIPDLRNSAPVAMRRNEGQNLKFGLESNLEFHFRILSNRARNSWNGERKRRRTGTGNPFTVVLALNWFSIILLPDQYLRALDLLEFRIRTRRTTRHARRIGLVKIFDNLRGDLGVAMQVDVRRWRCWPRCRKPGSTKLPVRWLFMPVGVGLRLRLTQFMMRAVSTRSLPGCDGGYGLRRTRRYRRSDRMPPDLMDGSEQRRWCPELP